MKRLVPFRQEIATIIASKLYGHITSIMEFDEHSEVYIHTNEHEADKHEWKLSGHFRSSGL